MKNRFLPYSPHGNLLSRNRQMNRFPLQSIIPTIISQHIVYMINASGKRKKVATVTPSVARKRIQTFRLLICYISQRRFPLHRPSQYTWIFSDFRRLPKYPHYSESHHEDSQSIISYRFSILFRNTNRFLVEYCEYF